MFVLNAFSGSDEWASATLSQRVSYIEDAKVGLLKVGFEAPATASIEKGMTEFLADHGREDVGSAYAVVVGELMLAQRLWFKKAS